MRWAKYKVHTWDTRNAYAILIEKHQGVGRNRKTLKWILNK